MSIGLTHRVDVDRLVDLEMLAGDRIDGVWKDAVQWGDTAIVITMNSVYILRVLDDGNVIASGGWFDRERSGPEVVHVSGCTWGGTAINRQLLAAPGLHLEFGNGVVTTRIHRVFVTRARSTPN